MTNDRFCKHCGSQIANDWVYCKKCGKQLKQNINNKRCYICGVSQALPFTCNYCGNVFCSTHRLPEGHSCTGIHSERPSTPYSNARPTNSTTRTQPRPGYFEVSYTYPNTGYSKEPTEQQLKAYFAERGLWSSGNEIYDILIGSALIGLFTLGIFLFYANSLLELVIAIILGTGTGFIGHELAHKYTAQYYGFPGRFVLWKQGVLLTLFSAVFVLLGGFFGMAAPGFVLIIGNLDKEINGRVSAAGPAWNIVSAISCLLIGLIIDSIFGTGIINILAIVALINATLAGFNLLPFGIMDGKKVMDWNPTVWIVLLGCAVLLYLLIPAIFFLQI